MKPDASLLGLVLALTFSPGLPAAAAMQDGAARLSTIQMPEGFDIQRASIQDVDGDGAADLVVASGGSVRRLGVHLRRKSGPAFASAPDMSLDLTPDVIAFAVADVLSDAGREIVLFNAAAVFAWRPRAKADDKERIVRLAAGDLLWQIPDEKDIIDWQVGIADLDHDGLDDLALPGPGVYRLLVQRRDAGGKSDFSAAFDLVIEGAGVRGIAGDLSEKKAQVREAGGKHGVSRGGRRVSFDLGDEGFSIRESRKEGEPLVSVDESVPAAQLVDWDGDGDLDAVFMTLGQVLVFRQEPRGRFEDAPRLSLPNPVAADRSRQLDVSYSAWTLDFSGDRRADCLIFAGDQRSDDTRTQVLVFLQDAKDAAGIWDAARYPLFGKDGTPRELLVIGGFARPLGLEDVDGDGRPDLVAGAVKPDLIDAVRAASSERIDVDLFVYRSTEAGFEKHPGLARRISLPAGNLDATLQFVGDLTGDGLSELVARDDKEKLRVYMTKRRSSNELVVLDKPLWELSVEKDARLLAPQRMGPGKWDLFVLEKEQILCASFR